MTLSTRLIVLFIAIVLCGAAGGQNEQHEMPRPPSSYCVIVPLKTMWEVHELLRGAREDVNWINDSRLERATVRIDQAENWLHSFPLEVCPATKVETKP
jgi:hypothetical protein